MDDILSARKGGVLTVTLNRPKLRNAISRDMGAALTSILREAQQDARVRCLLLKGEGPHFTAGGDIAGFNRSLELPPAQRQQEWGTRLDHVADMVRALLAFDGPIVARCTGAVAGAGLLLTLAADLVPADPSSTFLFAHQRMAMSPDCGVSWLLPRVIGLRQAKRLLLTAAKVESAEALQLGLITSLHTPDELDDAVARMVEGLARAPQRAVRTAKRLLNASLSQTADAQLVDERAGIVACVADDDFAEAVASFMERRAPLFPSGADPS